MYIQREWSSTHVYGCFGQCKFIGKNNKAMFIYKYVNEETGVIPKMVISDNIASTPFPTISFTILTIFGDGRNDD